MSAVIGIDLGTTYSLCSVFQDGTPTLIPNAHGDYLTPSVVGMMDDGRIVVGRAASELGVVKPESAIHCIKRHMGTGKKVSLGGRDFMPEEISSLILQSLKGDAEARLGAPVTEAVITVPAYFNDDQRLATKLAGEYAGLTVKRIINEPTAAALTYGFHEQAAEKTLLVLDLGGGTFDVTLMDIFEGAMEIVATAGESFLGGEDFTARLAGWALRKQNLNLETLEFREPLRAARLREECERAKRALSAAPQVEIRMPDARGYLAENTETVRVTPADLLEMSGDFLERIQATVMKALRDGNRRPQDVDDVILVGGATRMPMIDNYVRREFSRPALISFNPDEVVALGACVQAALLGQDKAVEDMVVTDVCPFSLGMAIMKRFGAEMRDGYYLPVIHRNTTIPVSREEVVFTVKANQTELLIKVYQGESRKVENNLYLGELSVTGLPPGPEDQPIHVRFTYDPNGILEVEAWVPSIDKKFQTVLTRHSKNLSKGEIKSAVRRLQSLKFYPRDELRNRELLLFCERLVGELSLFDREKLEGLLDGYESAMASGSPEIFNEARRDLLIFLSGAGIEYTDKPDSEPK